MNNEKVTIIVPLYNGEKTVEKCLNSIINQTYKNLEIIVINDASTDNSLNIINWIASKDERINIITNLKNMGPSYGRNIAISKATGEYIMFCDADDWMEENAVEVAINSIKEKKVDILRFSFKRVFENRKEKIDTYTDEYINTIFTKDNLHIFTNDLLKNRIQAYTWAGIYKTDIIKNVKFNENIVMMEDTLWYIKILNKVEKIAFINEVIYNYFVNDTSESRSFSKAKRNIKNIFIINSEYNINFEKLNQKKQYQVVYSTGLMKVVIENIFKYALSDEDIKVKKKYFKEILKNNEYIELKNNTNFKEIRFDRRILIYFMNCKLISLMILYCKLKEFLKKIKN